MVRKMAERQHYLPQFYLKEFTDPETPKGQEPYLWIYKYESRKWEKKAPRNIACKPDFYTVIGQQGKRWDGIEDALSVVEGKTASVYRSKVYNREFLESEEKAVIAEFVALMMVRVPRFLNMIDSLMSKALTRMMRICFARPEGIKELKKWYKKSKGKEMPENFDMSRLDPSRYKISISKSFLLKMIIKPIRQVANIIYSMTWTFLHTTEQAWFITSDSPFFMWNPKSKLAWYGHGLIFPDIEVSVPFSRQICLLATWKKKMPEHIDVGQDAVKVLNYNRIVASEKFLISPQNDFIASRYLEYKTEGKNKKQIRKALVW